MLAALGANHQRLDEIFVIQNLIAVRTLCPDAARYRATPLLIGRFRRGEFWKNACNPTH